MTLLTPKSQTFTYCFEFMSRLSSLISRWRTLCFCNIYMMPTNYPKMDLAWFSGTEFPYRLVQWTIIHYPSDISLDLHPWHTPLWWRFASWFQTPHTIEWSSGRQTVVWGSWSPTPPVSSHFQTSNSPYRLFSSPQSVQSTLALPNTLLRKHRVQSHNRVYSTLVLWEESSSLHERCTQFCWPGSFVPIRIPQQKSM